MDEGAQGQAADRDLGDAEPENVALEPPEPLGVELEFERGQVDFEDESVDAWLAYGEEKLGPMVMARAALEPQGKWDALRADLEALYHRENKATDGSFRVEPEYLVTVARLPVSR